MLWLNKIRPFPLEQRVSEVARPMLARNRAWILFLVLVWVPLRSAVIDYSPVPTGSMNPTILEGDVVWIDKLAYGLRLPLTTVHLAQWADPRRGDIVVVLSPQDGTRLVKRVIGVPGDTIAVTDNRVFINGRPLADASPARDYRPTIGRGLRSAAVFAEEDLDGVVHPVMALVGVSGAPRTTAPVTIGPGEYFLMGDSRDNSFDSRGFGLVKRNAVLGKAEGVFVSLDLNDTYLPRWGRFLTPLK